jgi:dTDP-4-amino-4,6-dideoxygalactose transaminase
MDSERIFVTKPSLPPLEELQPFLNEIWKSRTLTNNGPFHQMLEEELRSYLGVKFISLFSNATIALITALKALNIRGEVITTPFSFVATSHALRWNALQPVFIDIDEDSLNLKPENIEKAINSNTTAILPVHVYGYPCDTEKIHEIAQRNKLSVIYDSAHAFGIKCHCGSLLNHGDLSVLSFHATKVFNTFEGGAIISHDIKMKERVDSLKNFGFLNETSVINIGINGKMNEFSAALGLLQLKYIDKFIEQRREIDAFYRERLKTVRGIKLYNPPNLKNHNFGYFPIFVENHFPLTRDALYEKLKRNGIHARRYFFPLIPHFKAYQKSANTMKNTKLPIAEDAANRVLCLPIYPDLAKKEQDKIVALIRGSF